MLVAIVVFNSNGLFATELTSRGSPGIMESSLVTPASTSASVTSPPGYVAKALALYAANISKFKPSPALNLVPPAPVVPSSKNLEPFLPSILFTTIVSL